MSTPVSAESHDNCEESISTQSLMGGASGKNFPQIKDQVPTYLFCKSLNLIFKFLFSHIFQHIYLQYLHKFSDSFTSLNSVIKIFIHKKDLKMYPLIKFQFLQNWMKNRSRVDWSKPSSRVAPPPPTPREITKP